MIERGMVSLQVCNYLVFDEADRMLDMGFEPQIRDIVDNCDMPPKGERQTAMFSATFPQNIQRLAGDFLTKTYIFLTIGRVGAATENVTQTVEYAQDNQKRDKLMQKLETAEGLTLIFVETKRNADGLERFISDQGIAATSIHGDRDQWEREQALKEFRSGRCPVLVATSVAARGLDIPNVVLVINYDTPNNIDDYVHRIGRTGRAGHHGMAVSFVNESTRILGDVLHLMEENKSEIAPWFKDLVRENRSYGGKKKGRKSNYGSRDYRNNRGGDRERGNDRGREQDRGYGGQSNRSSGQHQGYSNNSGRSDNSSW
jgi:ATP-dependent RNA helicase DDX3X